MKSPSFRFPLARLGGLSLALFALALSALVSASGCSGSAAPGSKEMEAPKVTVALPRVMELTDFEDFTGRTDAVDAVDVRARVTGYLDDVDFQSGKEVQKGAPLFLIDPRPYQAEYDRLTAQVTLAKARLGLAVADLARAEKLLPGKAISQQDYDKYAAAQAEAAASVKATEANVEGARLNLEFTRITSPITGRVSRNLITPGNLVQADATLLTTVVSQDPMYAYFDCDELTMLKIQTGIRQGKIDSARNHDVPVFMGLANEKGYPHRGVIDFVDNRVSTSTGTLKVRAVFPNPLVTSDERMLSPGLFVRIHVPIGKPTKTLLVPDRAVVTDQGLQVLYIVDKDNKVVQKQVTVGRKHGEWRVIEKGLVEGEKVVVSGLQRLQPGRTVRPRVTNDPVPMGAQPPVLLKDEVPHGGKEDPPAKEPEKSEPDKAAAESLPTEKSGPTSSTPASPEKDLPKK